MIDILLKLFERDLNALEKEVELYSNEEILWSKEGQVNNSAGTLVLHLCGNMQHFIGATLGNTGYVRNRSQEFDLKINRDQLLKEIEITKSTVLSTLKNVTQEQLDSDFPIDVFGYQMTTAFFLTHLHGHLTYHLGQISYHRRILDV
ncbi:MAG: DinB family protein [Crocinitomicaceae bacterium]|nr:DinB family protein [Crocinitomicaceae bacterium]